MCCYWYAAVVQNPTVNTTIPNQSCKDRESFLGRSFYEYVQIGCSNHSKWEDYRKREFIGKRQLHDGSAAKIYGVASADGYKEV